MAGVPFPVPCDMASTPLLILYDAQCPVCRAARHWLERRAPAGSLEFLDCRGDERARRLPEVSESACLEAIHAIRPDGATRVGADALPWLLSTIPRWRWLGRALSMPLIRHLARPTYRLIARHRLRLSCSSRRCT